MDHLKRKTILMVLLMLGFVFTAHAAHVTMNMSNVKVVQAMKQLKKLTGYTFVYYSKDIDADKRVSVSATNAEIDDVVSQILVGQNVSYSINGKRIIVTKKTASSPRTVQPAQQAKGSVKTSGRVTDANGEPIIGATVRQAGTNNATVTDVDGNFTINAPRGAKLEVTYVGFLSQAVIATDGSLDVKLQESNNVLDDVVVVAYGTQKARSVTAAMSRINEKELADMPVANITQRMQGKFAGVQIIQNTGEPNGNLAIRVRGSASINGGSSPLVVVDGFPLSSGLEGLAPDEIETITILKDAAATSLYGSRAANGVILVTTKQGKKGKTEVTATVNMGFNKVPNRGFPDVMNAQEFAEFKKEMYEDAQRYLGSTTPVPECYANPSAIKNGTDWFKILLRTAFKQEYNLNIVGGNDAVRSTVNANYDDTNGVIINSYSRRFSFRSNNIFTAGKHWTFGLNLSGAFIKLQLQEGIGNGRNIIESAFLMDPQLKYKNDDGTYPIAYSQPGMLANANYYLVLRDRKNPRKTIRATANAWAQLEIIDGLKYRVSANLDGGGSSQERWVPDYVNGGIFSAPPNPAVGRYNSYNFYNWMVENTLNYQKTLFGAHNIDVLVGYTAQKASDIRAQIDATQYADNSVGFFNAATIKNGSGDKSAWSMLSYLARVNYDYKDKYILSLSYRRDGCSRFGADARWAGFPSVSVGWVPSEEKWFKENVPVIDFLKLRTSWGKVGNNNIGNFTSIAIMATTNYVYNGSIVPGRSINGIGNRDLTWETTKQWDFGFDVSLLKDRIYFMYDYYRKCTNGLLYQIDVPYTSGYGSVMSNIGEFHFWGHEFTLQTRNLTGAFKWNTDINITIDRNKVMKLGTNNTPIGGYNNYTDFNRTAVGHPIGMFFGYVYDGVYMTQEEYDSQPKHVTSAVGTVRMKDLNNDNVIDTKDKTFIGDPNPDLLYGITNTFSWKNFDASIVISGSLGNEILDETLEATENLEGVFNVRKCVKDRWRSLENPGKGEVPRTSVGTELFRFVNSRWVYDGDYLMVKNLTLGYTVPFKPNSYLSKLRVYCSIQNLLTITNYPGMNPEISNAGLNAASGGYGVDYTAYPVPRTVTFGLNISF